jgi:RHS repeat-associated protein
MKVDKTGITRYITSSGKVLSEYDGDDNLKYNYIYGNGKKLARKNSAGIVMYIHNDPESLTLSGQVYLGSVRAISNNVDNVVWTRDYMPFGEDISGIPTENAYKFTGKVGVPMKSGRRSRLSGKWDEESDLYYSPVLGRFTQVDPLWMKYPSLSPYNYCANNPLKYVDPSGKGPEDAYAAALALTLSSPIPGDEVIMGLLWIGVAIVESANADASGVEITILDETTTQRNNNKSEEKTKSGKKSLDSCPNEKHGKGEIAKSKVETQVKNLKDQLKDAVGKEKAKIKQKIKNLEETARKKAKGT